jgi:hypothetical protein
MEVLDSVPLTTCIVNPGAAAPVVAASDTCKLVEESLASFDCVLKTYHYREYSALMEYVPSIMIYSPCTSALSAKLNFLDI